MSNPAFHPRFFASALVCVGLGGAARAAPPEPPAPAVMVPELPLARDVAPAQEAEGQRLYRDASSHFTAGRHKKALVAARAAYQLWPSWQSATLLGAALLAAKSPCEAFALGLLADELSPARTEQVLRVLVDAGRGCGGGMGWAKVAGTPAEARIEVGGLRFLGPRTVGLSAGAHALGIEADGYRATTRELSVLAGAPSDLRFALEPLPRPAVADPDPVAPPTPLEPPPRVEVTELATPVDSAPRTAGQVLIGVGATASAAGLAALFASLALWLDAQRTPEADAAAYRAQRASYQDTRTAGIVTAAAGVAALGVGIALFALAPDPTVAEARVRVAPQVGPNGAGLQWVVGF